MTDNSILDSSSTKEFLNDKQAFSAYSVALLHGFVPGDCSGCLAQQWVCLPRGPRDMSECGCYYR